MGKTVTQPFELLPAGPDSQTETELDEVFIGSIGEHTNKYMEKLTMTLPMVLSEE